MILHLKKDSVLLDKVNSKRYTWQAGQHSVNDDLAKHLLENYPELFEEVSGMDGIPLTPNPIHTTEPTVAEPDVFTCDVCGKVVASQLALIGHKRTHAKGIGTQDFPTGH